MVASAPSLPNVGDTIAGKYKLVRLIAEGGMGVVYEGVHKRLDQRVALKFLYPHYTTNEEICTRFDLEGRIASRLQGLNVARVYDIDALPNGVLYMVMELLSGHDLETELQSKGQLQVADVTDIITQAAIGMREAHALGVVHRDLKPANIFLTPIPDSTRYVAKVLDFGISRMVTGEAKRVTADLSLLGTALYMSPEQAKSSADVDARSDIWSLGIIMYELLTGQPPFEGQITDILVQVATAPIRSPRIARPDIPEGLERVILRALERDLRKRFQTMDELIVALQPYAPQESIELLAQRMPRAVDPTTLIDEKPSTKKRSVAIGAGLLVAGLVGTLLIGLSLNARAKAQAPIEAQFEPLPSPVVPMSAAMTPTSATSAVADPGPTIEIVDAPRPATSHGASPRTTKKTKTTSEPSTSPRRL